MVSIGGDRATNADYRRANTAAIKRSRSKAAPRPSKVLPSREPAVRRPVRDPEGPPRQQPRPLGQPLVRNGPAPTPPRYNPSAPPPPVARYNPGPQPVSDADSLTKKMQQGQADMLKAQGVDPKKAIPNYVAPANGQQAGVAPANGQPPNVGPPPPEISDGVREILNDRNWKLPSRGKTVDMPKSSFEKGGTVDLKDHDYRLSLEEWDRIEKTYSSTAAQQAGYIPPAATAKAVDKNTPMMHMQDEDSAALTWDAYEKLSGDQKAAIDFNTLLVEAREEDLGQKTTLSAPERTKYDKEVTDMFGEGRGSTTTAVHTIDLLSQLDMKVVGQDLDEYLSLERAIDTKELGDFEFSKSDVETLQALANGSDQTPDAASAYAAARTPENMARVDTADVQQAQQLIKTKLAGAPSAAATYDFDTLMYGAGKDMKQPPLGFGDANTQWSSKKDAQLDEWFQSAITILGADDPTQYGYPAGGDTMGALLGNLDGLTLGNAKAKQQFLDYVQNRVDMAGQYGTPDNVALAAKLAQRAGLGG